MKKRFAVPALICLLFVSTQIAQAQYSIAPPEGYSTQVGNLVSMLEDLKGRVTRSVVELSPEETDFLLDDQANRIGALIYHLAATEKFYQVYTFENRQFNEAEVAMWDTALRLGDNARAQLVDQPISYYLDLWGEVRANTLRLLKEKDDAWLASLTGSGEMNNHWAWYHVMEHQANHMGQIRLILGRMGK